MLGIELLRILKAYSVLQPVGLWSLEEGMTLEAKVEGWRGEADIPSTLRRVVNDMGGNDVSISSIKCTRVLPRM